MVGIAIGCIVVAITVWTFSHVDNWSRDLTTNVAELSEDATDSDLKPLVSDSPPETIADQVADWVEQQASWELVTREQNEAGVEMHITRTTSIFRYVDDIQITIDRTNAGSKVYAKSKSRVGKGDLGQNPRNLKELVSAINAAAR